MTLGFSALQMSTMLDDYRVGSEGRRGINEFAFTLTFSSKQKKWREATQGVMEGIGKTQVSGYRCGLQFSTAGECRQQNPPFLICGV